MLMSANERDINLHSKNDLGEDGLPSYHQVVIGGRREEDLCESNKENTTNETSGRRDDEILLSSREENNAKELTLLQQHMRDSPIVPPNKENSDHPCGDNNSSKRNVEPSNELKSITCCTESYNFPSSLSTNNQSRQHQKNECTTYVISNKKSCTLQVKSAGFVEIGNKKNKVGVK